MSNAVFPSLRGLTWNITKAPQFSTKVQEAVSGRETRAAYWSYPRWTFKLQYSFLNDVNADLQTIAGFFLARRGSFDDFLYLDPEDNTATNQTIGTGDGLKTTFQLCRTFGSQGNSFIEPIFGIKGTPTIRLNGVQTTDFSVSDHGLVAFDTAPSSGVNIAADIQFYFRCRFTKDSQEYNEFASRLWELKTCEFISLKQ